MRRLITAGIFAAGLAGLVSAPAHADGKDVRWSVTIDMHMTQPMSMDMPGYTVKTCAPEDAEKGPPPMKNGDCKVEHFDRSGDRISYKVSCDQKGTQMTGEGWTEKTDADHYKGSMKMQGNTGGTPIAMNMSYTGTRIGTCTADK